MMQTSDCSRFGAGEQAHEATRCPAFSADFHATGSTQGSDELVAQSPVVPPGHWGGGGEFGFAEDGGVGPSVEADGDGVVGGDDFAGGLEEPALQGVGGDGGVAG